MSVLRPIAIGEHDIEQWRFQKDVYAANTRRKLLFLLKVVEELPLNELTVHFQMGRTAVYKQLEFQKERITKLNLWRNKK